MRAPLRRQVALALLLAAAVVAQAGEPVPRARLQFLQHCSGCHGADGSGTPAKGVPSMQGTLGRFLALPGGREFIVQVPGVMNAPLSDRDVAALMNWLLPQVSAATLPAAHRPYEADEITVLRATRPADVAAVRRGLVAASQAAGHPIPP